MSDESPIEPNALGRLGPAYRDAMEKDAAEISPDTFRLFLKKINLQWGAPDEDGERNASFDSKDLPLRGNKLESLLSIHADIKSPIIREEGHIITLYFTKKAVEQLQQFIDSAPLKTPGNFGR